MVIYRCVERDIQKPAWFGSVATSLCIVDEITPARQFQSADHFVNYCKKYSVFDDATLHRLYVKYGIYAVKMSYNLAFPKRPTLGAMVENVVVPSPFAIPRPYLGLYRLGDAAFSKILELGGVREGFVIH